MSTGKLEIEWQDTPDESVASVPLNTAGWVGSKLKNPTLTREIATAPGAGRCPHCQSIIYSRKAKLCGICSHPIPEEMRFNSTDTNRVQTLLDIERRRHREWINKCLKQTLAVI